MSACPIGGDIKTDRHDAQAGLSHVRAEQDRMGGAQEVLDVVPCGFGGLRPSLVGRIIGRFYYLSLYICVCLCTRYIRTLVLLYVCHLHSYFFHNSVHFDVNLES